MVGHAVARSVDPPSNSRKVVPKTMFATRAKNEISGQNMSWQGTSRRWSAGGETQSSGDCPGMRVARSVDPPSNSPCTSYCYW